ncbi:MAG TPA: VanW family protein [Candidatus Pullilachnospira gallistercoris]|uniref:VanW family protein n=1 Tax=Candidatus Pullilachnospira gallistercoris TaxID=2840911 RepID=A0A9D1E919_9FIRM|nr:VanW family protein [Candidatus Pullilachnospira gallistercoris]
MSLEIRRLRGLPLFLALWTAGFLLLSPVTGKAQESSGTADETSQEDTGADAAESAGDEADTAETGTIPENIFISGQNVSGMTADEANQVVADYLSGYGDVEFTLQAGEKSVTADGEDIGLTAKNADVVTRALNYGKEGNLVSRYKANKDMENGVKKDFAISLTADINTAKTYLDENSDELNIKAVNNGLKRENGSFTYVEGSSGVTVLTDQSAVLIADYISAQWSGENATIDLITEVTEPKGTREELAQVQDVLGSFETDFSSSSSARKKNVRTGAEKLNGIVLYPGDTLSVYEAVSPFDAENGYALAPSYENGTTVDSYGGGICQVSTTLYNAVMRAELEIVTRSAHSMIVTYVEPSMDAAIAGTFKDLQFKNNQETPIYIEGYTNGGTLGFRIYGKETRPDNRKVTFESEVTSQTDPVREFVASQDLPVGTIKKTQSSHTGYTARLWKIVTVDGVEESRKVYNNSTYKASNEIYSVGLANASPEAAAAINNAIATQNEDTIRATVSQWANGGTAPQTTQQAPQTTAPAADTSGQTAGNPAAGTDQSGGQTTAQ